MKELVEKAAEKNWFFNLQYVDIKKRGGWQWIATFARRAEVRSLNYSAYDKDMQIAFDEAYKQIEEHLK